MSASGVNNTIIDLWVRLHVLFDPKSEDYGEIDIDGLTEDGMRMTVLYLLHCARECNTSLVLTDTDEAVTAPAPDTAALALATGYVIGALYLDVPVMPSLGVFIEQPDMLSLSYARGDAWTPLALVALFELLRDIHSMNPHVHIALAPRLAPPEHQTLFSRTVQDYMNEIC